MKYIPIGQKFKQIVIPQLVYKNQKTACFLAFIAGILLPFAFAPFNYTFLAIISPSFLLALLLNSTPREAFWRGWWYGLGYFGVGVSWVYVSIHYYGDTPVFIAGMFTLLFAGFLGLFPAVQAYCLQWFFPDNRTNGVIKATLYFPISWVLIEWVRSWILTGFPWLQLGHSQVSSYLSGFIPLVGVFGVTMIVTFLSGLLYVVCEKKQWKKKIVALFIFLSVFIIGAILERIQWTTPQAGALRVALVQGNIPQSLKWSSSELNHTLKVYPELSQPIWKTSDLVVWPEAAVTLPIPWSLTYLNNLLKTIRPYPVSLITGIPVQSQNSWKYYNAMVMLSPIAVDVYYKRYLVPFGEYLPLEQWLKGIVGFFALPMSDFISGGNGSDVVLQNKHNVAVAPFICYEIAYPDAILTTVKHANLMVVISNDTWFGDSLAPWQHLQIAQFAALAAGRYLLFSTNDGITSVIDPQGHVVASAPRFREAVLQSKIFLMTGNTPWVVWGHNYILVLLVLVLFIGRLLEKRFK